MFCCKLSIRILCVHMQAFATWKQHHEDLLQDKAVAHDNRRHTARALAAWQLGVALIHRKRSLTAAAVQQCRAHRMRHSLSVWMRFTYYKHMGHVVLHFRVRRLACVVLREWQEVGGCLMNACWLAGVKAGCLSLGMLWSTFETTICCTKEIIINTQPKLPAPWRTDTCFLNFNLPSLSADVCWSRLHVCAVRSAAQHSC